MKHSKFKRLFSSVMSAVMAINAVPFISGNAEESTDPYPYTMFAASDEEGAITINADNICINGNVATKGTIVTSTPNFNVNGTKTEHSEEEMIYFFKKLDYAYFNTDNAETYFEDYYLEEQNINVNVPLEAEGNVELVGNISVSSGIKALNDVILDGNVENTNDSVICSQTGDILINTENVNLNGIVYAPEGCINITAKNLNINSVVMIADTINITCPSMNANYNSKMADFIGTESEIELDVIAYGSFLSESNSIDVNWYTTIPRGTFEIQISDDNENYITVGTVSDANSYQYIITEEFEKKYVRVVETTYYGETYASIPFVVTKTEDSYTVDFLDSDEDGLPDIYEISIGTDINDPDSDKDDLTDFQEVFVTQTDPTIYDSVVEGVSDSEADCDEDGLSNAEEIERGTNPLSADTDDDKLSDYDEIYVYGTDPLVPDTDEDGIEDGAEPKIRLDPTNPETFGVPDDEYSIKQEVKSDSAVFSSVNTEENAYEMSIELKTNRYVEGELTVSESGYAKVIENDAMIGLSADISISNTCNPEEIVLKYNIKDAYIENTLNKYSSLEEFQGIKRLIYLSFMKILICCFQ